MPYSQDSAASVSSPSSASHEMFDIANGSSTETAWNTPIDSEPYSCTLEWSITSYLKLSPNVGNMAEQYMENWHGIPTWTVLTANNLAGRHCVNASIRELHKQAEQLLADGTSIEEITGTHPNIAALFDPEEYARTSLLSRWAARFVWSLQLKCVDFTVFAMMYLAWCKMRWMIDTRKETYEAIPPWLRPTPYQLLVPHAELFDFLIWPKLRDYAVTSSSMRSNLEWLMEMFLTLTCVWPGMAREALLRNSGTGDIDLTDIAKVRNSIVQIVKIVS